MTPTKCAVFYAEGITQIVYAFQNDFTEVFENSVPENIPFVVKNINELPSRETRNEWSFDYSSPSGFGKFKG